MSDEKENLSTPTDTPVPDAFFALIVAEIIFETDIGVASRRIQFFSQYTAPIFPAHRLNHLLQVAAHQVKTSMPKAKNWTLHEVLFLNIIQLGQMSQEEFYGETVKVEAPAPIPAVQDIQGADMTNVSMLPMDK